MKEINGEAICLCGSTKYKTHYQLLNTMLTLQDNVVLSVSCFGHSDNLPFNESEKQLLDKVHKHKISISDTIVVIDPKKYVGHSTSSEISFADGSGVDVVLLSDGDNYQEFIDWVNEKVSLGWWGSVNVLEQLELEKTLGNDILIYIR